MQDRESAMGFLWKLKLQSLGLIVRNHSASPVMSKSYIRDGMFSVHLKAILDSYNNKCLNLEKLFSEMFSTSSHPNSKNRNFI